MTKKSANEKQIELNSAHVMSFLSLLGVLILIAYLGFRSDPQMPVYTAVFDSLAADRICRMMDSYIGCEYSRSDNLDQCIQEESTIDSKFQQKLKLVPKEWQAYIPAPRGIAGVDCYARYYENSCEGTVKYCIQTLNLLFTVQAQSEMVKQ